MKRLVTGAMTVAVGLLLGGASAVEDTPALTIALTPSAPDMAGNVPSIELEIVATGVQARPGAPLLRLPAEANTVITSADDISGLVVSDQDGPLSLDAGDVAQDGSNKERRWRTSRAIAGAMKVRYRVTIDVTRPPLVAPQYELRTGTGTVSGAANSFIILPADDRPRRTSVHWDLSRQGPGAIGVSSFGVGDATSSELMSAERVGATYYMAGTAGLYRAPTGGFFGVWQGKPAFDTAVVMHWAAHLYHYYGSFFGYSPASFGVFGRSNPGNPGSGIGLTDSFAFTFGPGSTAKDMRTLLAHEMLHAWVRSLDETMDAPNGLGSSWFGEGLAVYYQRLLPYRAGLISAQAFLADLNETAGRYYTNALIATPNAEIDAGFWKDTRIRVLPYDRGSLYFARVDAAIRARSHGKRSLDDLVRAMLSARRQGAAMSQALWLKMLRAELGEAGVASFQAMLAGSTVLPPSSAFGPCFERTSLPLRRWDLGFDPASLTGSPKIVRGLIPGSNAAKAGLRNGDRISRSFPQDGPQGDQQAMLDLHVERGGLPLTILYSPRGETLPAWQWHMRSSARQHCETDSDR